MAAPAPDFDSLDWKKFTGGNLDLVKELALEEEEVGGWTFVVEAKAVRVVKKQVEDRPTSIIRVLCAFILSLTSAGERCYQCSCPRSLCLSQANRQAKGMGQHV